jgi:hypothetical protein
MAGGNSHGVCGAFLAEGDKDPDLRFAIFKQKAHAPAQARDASKPPEISTPDRHPERRPPFSINGARRLAAPRAMVCQFELGRDLTTSMSNLNSGKPWSETDLLDLEVGLALEISIEGIANVLLRDVEEVRQKVASLKAHPAAGPTR